MSLFISCSQKKVSSAPVESIDDRVPPAPQVTATFLSKALGPKTELASRPLIVDLDSRPGEEALVATHRAGKEYEIALIRGNHQVLAKAPMGGKVLMHAKVQAVGQMKLKLWSTIGNEVILVPVETLTNDRSLCGILVFRYRRDVMALIGEFALKCWRKEVGGENADPYSMMQIFGNMDGPLEIETQDDFGPRRYRWDKSQGAFMAVASPGTTVNKK